MNNYSDDMVVMVAIMMGLMMMNDNGQNDDNG